MIGMLDQEVLAGQLLGFHIRQHLKEWRIKGTNSKGTYQNQDQIAEMVLEDCYPAFAAANFRIKAVCVSYIITTVRPIAAFVIRCTKLQNARIDKLLYTLGR